MRRLLTFNVVESVHDNRLLAEKFVRVNLLRLGGNLANGERLNKKEEKRREWSNKKGRWRYLIRMSINAERGVHGLGGIPGTGRLGLANVPSHCQIKLLNRNPHMRHINALVAEEKLAVEVRLLDEVVVGA